MDDGTPTKRRPIRRPVTIRDVARQAAVSIATVSRVLNAAGEVSEATAEKVRRVVSEMGFRPSRVSRSLKTSRSHLLGVVADMPLAAGAATLTGAARAAHAAGYMLLLSVIDDPVARDEAIDLMYGYGAEGIILLSATATAASADPSVTAARPAEGEAAGAAAVARLLVGQSG
jgi:LacI family transcriptional regulator